MMGHPDQALLCPFAFAIHQKVAIPELKLNGTVLARCDRGTYREYRVVYWAESRRHDEWLLESELAPLGESER
jgi:hypothetical protein